ncbi:MAG: aminotransferase class V-fold PLP-dependent enzyme [Acidobacteria bacterium]|nr:aminotransferase class V-fold PLP-dependent enzyme [Acidobacteriota bacterium]
MGRPSSGHPRMAMLTDAQLRGIRSQFPILRKKTYLNSCSHRALSDAAEQGLREYFASWHEHGSPRDLWIEHYEAARTGFANFIDAEPQEIALVASASAAINSVSSLNFAERDNVVVGEFEFPTMGHTWLAQRRRGAQVVFVKAAGNEIPIENCDRAIERQNPHCSPDRYLVDERISPPVAEIVHRTHDRGALVMLDEYQHCGTHPVDVLALDVCLNAPGLVEELAQERIVCPSRHYGCGCLSRFTTRSTTGKPPSTGSTKRRPLVTSPHRERHLIACTWD